MMKHKRLNEVEMGESTADNTYVSMKDDEILTQVPANSANNNSNKKENVQSYPAPDYKGQSAFGPSYIRLWQIGIALCFVIIIILIIVLAVLQGNAGAGGGQIQEKLNQVHQMVVSLSSAAGASKYTGKSTMFKSCLELLKNGTRRDGYYYIAPKGDFDVPSQVYCDMTTDGGGWTLVASVHEDNINRKCDSHDMWSRFVDKDEIEQADAGNWVNDNTFGDAKSVTKMDYKGTAYGSLKAENLMIWHSPDKSFLSDSKESATLQYYTDNGFLKENGGNLKELFSKYQKLDVHKDYLLEQVNTMIDALTKKGQDIISKITDYHPYEYDGTYDYRMETGKGMFYRGGNQVSPRSDRCYGYLDYGENKTCDEGSAVFTSRKSKPFMAMALSMNEFNSDDNFGFRVRHNRPKASDDDTLLFGGNMTRNGFYLQYYSNNIYSNSTLYPAVSELHLLIGNEQKWNSTIPENFRKSYSYHSTSLNYYNSEFTSAYGRNIMSGYILLSTKTGTPIPKSEIVAACQVILDTISSYTSFVELAPSLSTPVKFAKGDADYVIKMSPPQFKGLYEPGYIQFSPRNAYGYPNALCPGVRVSTMHPEYLCIGGLAADNEDTYSTCGDFAGWNGISVDRSRSSSSIPKGWAHAHDDIYSTILIFYR